MSEATTLPGLLEERAQVRPRGVAFRQKRLGIWREVTWSAYAENVRAVALALDDVGVQPGARVALFADNDPRWLYADLGIQSVGAATAGIYPALDAPEAASAIVRSGARIVFCGDQEQVDKLLEAWGDAPPLERLIVFDATGLHTPEYEALPWQTFDELVARGNALLEERPTRFGELLAARTPDDIATIAFTSGTTGPVRGFLRAQRSELALAQMVASTIGLTARDMAYSLLPLAYANARLHDAYAPLVTGSSLGFAESLETVPIDMIEAAPTVIVATPRLLERVRGDVELRIERAGLVKRTAYRWAMGRLDAAAGKRSTGGRGSSPGAWLGNALVARFVRRQAGLDRVRYAGIGGSFVAPESLRWFWALGVPVREQYGQVESGGILTSQRSERDLGTAGAPIDPTIELRLDGEELRVRGPGLAAAALDGGDVVGSDGWYDTGDLARLDDVGRVVVIGRREHVLTTAAGEEISPAEIESALKASPYVRSAMVVAAGRPFVAALIELNEAAAADWARRKGISVSTSAALAANELVTELIAGEVRAASDRAPGRAPGARVPDPRPATPGRADTDREDPPGRRRARVRPADRRDVRRAGAHQPGRGGRGCLRPNLTLSRAPPSVRGPGVCSTEGAWLRRSRAFTPRRSA